MILALVRIQEPVYEFLLKREICSWFGVPLLRSKTDSRIKSASSFELMSSQLSIDLVYAILHSICENTVGVKKGTDSWLSY